MLSLVRCCRYDGQRLRATVHHGQLCGTRTSQKWLRPALSRPKMINMIPLKCWLQNSTYLPIGSAPDFVVDKVANRKKLSKLVRWANQTGSRLERARARCQRERRRSLASLIRHRRPPGWLVIFGACSSAGLPSKRAGAATKPAIVYLSEPARLARTGRGRKVSRRVARATQNQTKSNWRQHYRQQCR